MHTFEGHPEEDGRLSDGVYAVIRTALQEGRLPAGSRLVETELASALAVSRTPVREALRRLEADGLVRSEPHRGHVVVDPMADAALVFLIRERLEGLAAALAAEYITRTQLEELEDLQAAMEALVAQEPMDVERLVELNGELHRRISEACSSPRLIRMIERLYPQYMSYQVLRLYTDDERRRSIREHREILGALWRRDSETAERAIHAHLEHGKTVVLADMKRGREASMAQTATEGKANR
ncbi:MAG TPA: GntR family transcriptional regulator [Vicinamibacterales bacterium]|nr:GntR family transcriptional regulator [Vicinamibacterales bacterium]